MKLALWILVLVAITPSARAANSAVHDACQRLCNAQGECLRKCVAQAELFELSTEFINAAADFTKNPDDRMRALRSGADVQILGLCKETGWSLDNMMTCLRSYPTPEVIRNCKKLSVRQEEQVECVRLGKTQAEIDACNRLVPGSDSRLECLGLRVTANDTDVCGEEGGNTRKRMQCLEQTEAKRDEKLREGLRPDRKERGPASGDEP